MKTLLLILFLSIMISPIFAQTVPFQDINNYKYLQNADRTDEIIILMGEPDNNYKGYMSWIFMIDNNNFMIYEVILENGYLVEKHKKILEFGYFVGQDLKLKTFRYKEID